MIHTKRKFVKAHKVGDNVINLFSNSSQPSLTIPLGEDFFNTHQGMLITEGNEIIYGFHYQMGDKNLLIAEPDPIVLYFETARSASKNLKDQKQKLFYESDNVHNSLNNFYQFYVNATICATFLFNSLEAFINNLIPDDYVYSKNSDKCTENYNRSQIQKTLLFSEKIKTVIPQVTGKTFHDSHRYVDIKALKAFRDEIMHTKSQTQNKADFYKKLYTTALDFDYDTTLVSVREYINFYQPNLIEPCNCGKDI